MKTSTLLVRSLPAIPALAIVAAWWALDIAAKAGPPEPAAKPAPKAANPAPPPAPKPPANSRPSSPVDQDLTVVPANPTQPLLSLPGNETGLENADPTGTRLQPGIYTASPSIGIVVIPGPMDAAFEKPVGPGVRMPTVKPPLQLTPRSTARPLPAKR